MKITFLLFFLLLASLNARTIIINENSSAIDVLSMSEVYVDKTNSLSKEDVTSQNFQTNVHSEINLGIAPDSALWIRFTLKNDSNQSIKKILEYANPETEDLYFFDNDKVVLDGMFHHQGKRTTINPIFTIELNPQQESTYYVRAHCKISTLIAKLTLYNELDFLHSDYKHTIFIFIFFAVITTLFLYNFMLFIFTKDITYFYYILYLSTMMFFESVYLGVAQLYFFTDAISVFVTKGTIGYISILLFPMILFTMSFLNSKRFKRLHLILKSYLYVLPVVSILSFDNFFFDLNVMVIFFPLAFTLIFTAIYALRAGVKEALYYLVGWSMLIISLTLSVYESIGEGANIPYMNEVAFMLEAFMFSIALAHRIKIISQAKRDADVKLIEFQREEKELLQTLVQKKTQDLQDSLEEKEILYKELNHRVKNNIQMILSLIKLQIGTTRVKTTQEELRVTKNRIESIAHLYEILHLNGNSENFDTLTYYKSIVKTIQTNFAVDVEVIYDVKYDVDVHSSIYCGLIINELVTNSFKYAFVKSGTIKISSYKREDEIYLVVEDDGSGFEMKKNSSLGLTIVQTLAQQQLKGSLNVNSDQGTKTTIRWREDV